MTNSKLYDTFYRPQANKIMKDYSRKMDNLWKMYAKKMKEVV